MGRIYKTSVFYALQNKREERKTKRKRKEEGIHEPIYRTSVLYALKNKREETKTKRKRKKIKRKG